MFSLNLGLFHSRQTWYQKKKKPNKFKELQYQSVDPGKSLFCDISASDSFVKNVNSFLQLPNRSRIFSCCFCFIFPPQAQWMQFRPASYKLQAMSSVSEFRVFFHAYIKYIYIYIYEKGNGYFFLSSHRTQKTNSIYWSSVHTQKKTCSRKVYQESVH